MQEDHSAVSEEFRREKFQSPEYIGIANVNKHSKDIVNQEKQEDEQHYYHSLENHGCSGSNTEETVYTNEDSQESKVVPTQSVLCETPDPDANANTELG